MKIKLLLLTILLGTQEFLFGMGGPGATRPDIQQTTPVIQRQIPTLFELTVGPAAKSMEEKLIAFLNAGGDIPDFVATEIETKIPALLFVPVITRLALKGENLTVAQKLSLLNSVALSSYIEASDKSILNSLRAVLARVFKGELNFKGDITKKYLVKEGNIIETLLHKATREGDIPLMKILINAGADLNVQLRKQNEEEELKPSDDLVHGTPLHLAIRLGKINAVKLLIAAGADLNSLTVFFETPLDFAILKNNIEIVKLLLDAKANVNLKKEGFGLQDTILMGAVKLMNETEQNNLELLKLLIKAGADVNAIVDFGDFYSSYPQTALDIANSRNNREVSMLLKEYGAKTAAEVESGK